MPQRPRPTVVVLAAGLGSRFAAAAPAHAPHKLAQAMGPATVLGLTLEHVIATGCPLVVVTTDALVPLATQMVARRDVLVLDAATAARGVGHTIAAGVAERPDAAGWLVLPGDMPLIDPRSMIAVADALDSHPVAFTQYRGRRGHPVGFAAELYSELVTLDGDEGARRVVARFPAHAVVVDDPGVLVDIDTPDDLAQARRDSPEPAGRG